MSSRIRQLALNWQQIAADDARDAKRVYPTPLADALMAQSRARRNCAWELMRTLQAMEKENPLEGGPLSPLDADRESA
jgi:hypothetical protein